MRCFPELTYSIYADGELPEAEARQVEIHVENCLRCRDLVAQLRAENRLIAGALQDVEDLAAERLAVPVTRLRDVPHKFAPVAVVTVLASFFMQWVAQQIPDAADWLNPSALAGRVNLLSAAVFYVIDQGAAMLSSFVNLATFLIAFAIVVSAFLAVSRRGIRILRPGAGLLALLMLAVPGFSLEKRSSKTVVTVAANETIDDSLLASGDTVRVDGTVNGDLLAFGRRVEIRGDVKGDLISWGQRTDISGTVEGNIYTVGQTVEVAGRVGRNLYGWMQSFTLTPQARVGGGITAGGADVTLDGNVERSAMLFAGTADVRGEVGRDLTFAGGTLGLAPPAHVGGSLVARVKKRENVRVDPGVVIGGKTDITLVARKSRLLQSKFYFWEAVSFAGALLIGWLLLVFVPGFFHGVLQTMRSAGRSLGLGFAVLVATPVAIIILAITLVGIPVAVFGLGLYAAALYLAKIFVGALLGRALDKTPDTSTSRTFLALLVGMLILYVAVQIPYGIGFLLHLGIFCLGMGAFTWRLYRTYRPLPG